MKVKKFHFAILFTIIALFSLFGCSTRQKGYCIGLLYEDSRINTTLLSAEITDKLTVNGDEISAPNGSLYLIVDMEATVRDGKWDMISDFVIHKSAVNIFSFDQDLTNQITGFDLLESNSTEKQAIRLVFLIENDTEPLGSYSLVIEYADGACSSPFLLVEW